jgi:hypothetical protein
LPSYQTFVFRLNELEPTFQTLGQVLIESLEPKLATEIDSIVLRAVSRFRNLRICCS